MYNIITVKERGELKTAQTGSPKVGKMTKEYRLNSKVQGKEYLPCLYPANLRDEMEEMSANDTGTLVKYRMIFDHIKKGDTVHLWIDNSSSVNLVLHALVRFQIEGVKVEVLNADDNNERWGF